MAKKARKASTDSITVGTGGGRISHRLKELYDNPEVKYIAAGIAASALTKLMSTLSKRYPELSNLVSGGLDSVERKLVEFRNLNKDDRTFQH